MLERLRDEASNVVGLKVSDTPLAAFEKYLLPGFDIFVGPEALIADGMARGACGAVSALASALPREVAAVVRGPTAEGAARLGELRAFVERFPRQAALKRLLALQGVPVNADVRAPLRTLTAEEPTSSTRGTGRGSSGHPRRCREEAPRGGASSERCGYGTTITSTAPQFA